MAAPLLLLGLTGGSAYLSAGYLNQAALEDKNLEPKFMGMDARHVAVIAGVAATLLFGPLIGAVGAGLAAGGLISKSTTEQIKPGIEAILVRAQTGQLTQTNPPPEATPVPSTTDLAPPIREGEGGPLNAPSWARGMFAHPAF